MAVANSTLLVPATLLLTIISNLKLANGACQVKGYLQGKSGNCGGDDDCCVTGKRYPQYDCSPPVSDSTPATLTLNDFSEGGDGGGPSECDSRYHNNGEKVVALSTGWYNGGSRCGKNIRIGVNGKSVFVMVVDECDSVNGCDDEHGYQQPCKNNVVDASQAVWDAPWGSIQTLESITSRGLMHEAMHNK